MTQSVYFDPKIIKDFKDHAIHGLPMETCGLLLGSENHNGFNIVEVKTLRNIKPSPAYFEMHPNDVLEVNMYALEKGMDVIGVIHSHPQWPAMPSLTDISFMESNRGVWIILSISDNECNAFKLTSDDVITSLIM